MNEWVLDPLSIATSGYVGHGPTFGDYCPLPLAIASHGYIRFDVTGDDGLGGGHGAVVQVRPYQPLNVKGLTETEMLAVLAVLCIEDSEH